MKRSVSIGTVLLFIFFATYELTSRAHAHDQPAIASSALSFETTQASDARSAAKEKASGPALDCSACHGAGKALPYLGGALFHAGAHKAYDRGFHGRAIQNGKKAASCLDCHSIGGDLTTILPASAARSTINRANVAKTCGSCHGDKSAMSGTGISNRPFISYQESVHARAVSRGNTKAAVCTDCHNSHDILPASDSDSPIFKPNIPRTCGQCHSKIEAEYNQSVHGEAVARGVSRSPVCTDCHGIHSIKAHLDPVTSTTSRSLATASCAQCHEGVALSQEFGVAGGRVSSYQDSYHGLASKMGSKIVANCASCHGVHNILPSSDSRSMINAANLVSTCGQCHPGASENFVIGKLHLNVPSSQDTSSASPDIGSTMTGWVRWVYLWLIGVVIGGMIVHNVLVWLRKAIAKRRDPERSIPRMTGMQRFQHWVLLTSFIALVLTGFALKYPDSWIAPLLGGSEAFRRVCHRAAGMILLAVGLFHLGYLAFTREGRRGLIDLLPRKKDVTDFAQAVSYHVGARTSKPKFARFNYGEKLEYWGVVWGTTIMGLTGLMVWFKVEVFGFLPRWCIDVALSIHFYEAILATLVIVVWHFYNVIFDPDVYPLNWALVDGRVSEEYYKEEHELDYDQIMSARREQQEKQDHTGEMK
ncbi:MAG: cytochrome b/b6 domain-containing protein [Acidobacteriota bacterium]